MNAREVDFFFYFTGFLRVFCPFPDQADLSRLGTMLPIESSSAILLGSLFFIADR